MHFSVHFPDDFPLDEIQRFGEQLIAESTVVPGFIAPDFGALHPLAVRYMQNIEDRPVTVIADLNVISAITSLSGETQKLAIDEFDRSIGMLMAVCQFNDIQIDPSIAIHELAHSMGHDRALKTLGQFMAANNASPWEWLELARGNECRISTDACSAEDPGPLDRQLTRYRRNYLLALKIASLELEVKLKPIERILTFLDWMNKNMYFAGPAALLAAMYMSPNARKSGLLSQLRSADRAKALAGVRNQVWDITHLGEFTRRIREVGDDSRLLFATKDKKLAAFALLVSINPDAEDIAREFSKWWSPTDATLLGSIFANMFDEAASDRRIPLGEKEVDWLDAEMATIEQQILLWRTPAL